MATRRQQVIGWCYLAVAMGAVLWAAVAEAWLLAVNLVLIWALLAVVVGKVDQLEAAKVRHLAAGDAFLRKSEQLEASLHAAAAAAARHEIERLTTSIRDRKLQWLATSCRQH